MSKQTFSAWRIVLSLAAVCLLTRPDGEPGRAAEADPVVINDFDQTLQFSYQAWKDKVTVADGHAVLKNLKCNGGGGVNGALDLSAYANRSPAFKLRVNPGNQGQGLYLIFTDSAGRSGRWLFTLPEPSAEFVIVTPKGGAALTKPNAREDRNSPDQPGVPDLAHLSQYQMGGDWSKHTLDIEIDAILLVEPDAKLLAEREAYVKQEAEEAAQAAQRAAEAKAKLEKKRAALIKSYGYSGEDSPSVVNVALVAPEILSLVIEAQRIVPPTVTKYEPQPDDKKIEEKWADGGGNNGIRRAKLMRGGKYLGVLQGPKLDYLTTDEAYAGDPFLDFLADTVDNYTIVSTDDPAYAAGLKPAAVYRKTLPTNAQLPGGVYPTRHRIYLKLPSKLTAGKTYTVKTEHLNLKKPEPQLTVDYARLLSESVHVNQNGYRPDDPYKRATLSIWLGTGGAYKFPEGLKFSLVDEATRQPVYTGAVELVMDVDGQEQLWTKPAQNHAQTAVYKMDFSDFQTPGTYRVCVEGVGSSYPFEIGIQAWERAFLIQMRGLYHNRSGIDLGPPYTDFKKPRDFHPDDGAVVTRSTFDVMEKGQYDTSDIPAGDTGEVIKNAWGGYHDAGDWNPRRVTHMFTTFAQLELIEILPEYFSGLKLNIPPTSGEGLPDLITEALFEIDCFRRLQRPDGAIPYGIESQHDPMTGEISWLSTQHLYVLAPTIRDSWLYAAVAGRAAKVLRPLKPELAQVYLDSAIQAFNWAEADYAKRSAAGTLAKLQDLWMAIDSRNISALVLYDLTGEKKYHDVFLLDTCLKTPGQDLCAWGTHIQTDAAFLYARLDDAQADPQIKQNARAAVLKLADFSLAYAAGNAFNVTCREKGRPMFAGFFSVSGGMEVARAHFLTGKREYLAGAVQSCQFSTGCNPGNLVYTTGLGSNPVRHPLHLDSRSTGQAVPPGFTVFGNADIWNFRGSFWDINMQFANKPEQLWPDVYSWPIQETYFDVWLLVSTNEFVIDTWQQNVFVWGYLAARK